ncbi:MAG: membrane protease YdiL (CAAX protease family) [Flavobacteriales bacterium]
MWLWLEMSLLFILSPLLIVLPIPTAVKITAILLALTYSCMVSKKIGLFTRQKLIGDGWYILPSSMVLRFSLFVVLSFLFVWLYLPDSLFSVILGNPWLWLAICFFYAIFSVYPQEFLYRLFFFQRYQILFSNPYVFLFVNGCVFSFAHLFLNNALVFTLTFVGSLLFALTFKKSQSLMLVSIEHSVYGAWLFTLGLGEMLAFPSV